MNDFKVRKTVMAAMFAALTCVATLIIRIPVPGSGGYVHPGDALVILSGIFLGPETGFLAAGIGSALSDLIGGYAIYVPISFVVKGLSALAGAYAFLKLGRDKKKVWVGLAAAGLTDILLVAVGYFIPEIFLYGFGAAALSIIPNMIQGAVGTVLTILLYPVLRRAIRGSFPVRKRK